MPSVLPPSDISFITNSLRSRMERQYKTTLVLGTQAGGLFRASALSATLEPFGLSISSSLSASARFSELYRILTRPGVFSTAEIETMLTSVLSTTNISTADIYMVELIKLALFDTIVTTAADDLLEQALLRAGMREMRDFTILNMVSEIQRNTLYKIRQDRKQGGCRIIKVFGELTAQNYVTSDRYQYLSTNHALTDLLREILHHDCLVIGLDPLWDEELYRVFPVDGNALWFVNENELDETSPLYKACKARNARYVTDEQGRYDRFVTSLYSALAEKDIVTGQPSVSPQNIGLSNVPPQIPPSHLQLMTDPSLPVSPLSTPELSMVDTATIEVFLSYAPEDEPLLNRLLEHLAALRREQKIHIWYNRNILPGQQHAEEIDRHLHSAKLILLLVSAKFLDSDYIYSVEMRRALERLKAGEAYIVPIILSPVDWQSTPLGNLSPLPTDGKPVTSWRDTNSALVDITRGIRSVIARLSI